MQTLATERLVYREQAGFQTRNMATSMCMRSGAKRLYQQNHGEKARRYAKKSPDL